MLRSRTPCSISLRWSTSTRLPRPGHGLPCAWGWGVAVGGVGVDEEGGVLAVTRPGTVARPVGWGAARLARNGGGTPSWIFFSVAETKLASVNGERSSGFSRYCCVSFTSRIPELPAFLPCACLAFRRESLSNQHRTQIRRKGRGHSRFSRCHKAPPCPYSP